MIYSSDFSFSFITLSIPRTVVYGKKNVFAKDIISFHLRCLCYDFCGLSALVGCWSSVFIRRIIYNFLNVCPIDYTHFSVSGKLEIPWTGLTRPIGWLSLLQLTVLYRFTIVVYWKCLMAFSVVTLLFGVFCKCKSLCHRSESDIFLFPHCVHDCCGEEECLAWIPG